MMDFGMIAAAKDLDRDLAVLRAGALVTAPPTLRRRFDPMTPVWSWIREHRPQRHPGHRTDLPYNKYMPG